MKYIRLLIALIGGSLLFVFGILVFDFVGIVEISLSIWKSKSVGSLFFASFLPFVVMLTLTWKDPLIRIEGVKENALLLSCSYEVNMKMEIEKAKDELKRIVNSIILPYMQILKTYEEEKYVEYYLDIKESNALNKIAKGIILNTSYIEIAFEIVNDASVNVKITITSDKVASMFSNSDNRKLLNKIIEEIRCNRNLTIAST